MICFLCRFIVFPLVCCMPSCVNIHMSKFVLNIALEYYLTVFVFLLVNSLADHLVVQFTDKVVSLLPKKYANLG